MNAPLPSSIASGQSVSTVPADVLDAAVEGTAVAEPATLRGQLDQDRPTLLTFVRHFGCLFCREMVRDLRIASEAADGPGGKRRYPKVVFVHQGNVEQGDSFFGNYWPGVTAISDPPKRLYNAFQLDRGSVGQMFGPRVWACGLRAAAKGHRIGRPIGDPWTMPGLFLLQPAATGDAVVSWEHRPKHAGDHPDFAELAA
jgi:hypothetical protein